MKPQLQQIQNSLNEHGLNANFFEDLSTGRCTLRIEISPVATETRPYPSVVAKAKVSSVYNEGNHSLSISGQLLQVCIASYELKDGNSPFDVTKQAILALEAISGRCEATEHLLKDYFESCRADIFKQIDETRNELKESMTELTHAAATELLDDMADEAESSSTSRLINRSATRFVHILDNAGVARKVVLKVTFKRSKLYTMGSAKASKAEIIERITGNFIEKTTEE
jgi:DNA-binding FrmR family transcriptional regulator